MYLRTANAVGIAGGAMVAALLDKLIDRGALTADDAKSICDAAQNSLLPYTGNGGDAVEAARIISEISGRFS